MNTPRFIKTLCPWDGFYPLPALLCIVPFLVGIPVYAAAQETSAAPPPPLEIAAKADVPENINTRNDPGTAEETRSDYSTDEIFGSRSGLFHPYLSIREEWTDNLYNINFDEQSNLLTVLSPGIWIGLPRMQKIPLTLYPHNAAIGGVRFAVPTADSFDRFQAYLLAGADYKNYSEQSDLNHTAWRIEGLLQYNMPLGLSFRMFDKFTGDRDRYDIGSFVPEDFTVQEDGILLASSPSRIREYYSNQANITAIYELSDSYSLQFDYLNFYLDYDDEVNAWLDRMDHRYSVSLKYTYSPKTSLFLEYDFADIRYDTETDNDSSNSFYYAGVKWMATAKTTLSAKGGYQVREYDIVENNDNDTFSMEMALNYLITDKTKITMNVYKALEETDSLASRGRDTIVARIRYDQNFTYRIRGNVEFWYETSDYGGLERDGFFQTAGNREDKEFQVRPAVQYTISDWLLAELAYSFENRDSNDNLFDFTTHTLIFSLNAAL